MNAVTQASTVKHSITIPHDGDQIAYGKSMSGEDIAGSVDAIVASISEKFGAALRD
ncbi:hypothetical protein AB4374_00765 [Vibrio splendidus]